MTWKRYPEKPHPQARNCGVNLGALLNRQIAVVLEDEAEDDAKEQSLKRKPRQR